MKRTTPGACFTNGAELNSVVPDGLHYNCKWPSGSERLETSMAIHYARRNEPDGTQRDGKSAVPIGFL